MASLTEMIAVLPKPTTLSFSYPKDWGSEEGSFFAALADGNAVGALKTAGLQAMSTNNSGTAATSAKFGKAINNRNLAIFRDLPFRQVSFSWTLRPRNKDQAAAYAKFIQDIRVKSAPMLTQDGSLWDVADMIWSLTIKTDAPAPADIIFQANELVITGLDVNYTPNGFWSQHKDGYPTQTELSLSLMEVELAHRGRLLGGGGNIV